MISKVPDSICELKNLVFLAFPGNRELRTIPECVTTLPNLTFLNVSRCPNVQVPESLENSYDVVENALKYIKGMAKEAGVKNITFSSFRRGWDRRAAAYGFRPKQWICEV